MSDTGGLLGICEFTLGPWESGPVLHQHASVDEAFYVVAGHLELQLDDQRLQAAAGGFVWVLRGVANAAEPLHVLALALSGGIEELFAEQAAYLASVQGPPDLTVLDQIGARHGAPDAGTPDPREPAPSHRDDPPCRWRVEVLDAGKVVARHERAAGRYVEVLTLDHYLEVLQRKPGALPGATALAQAKASGGFTATHQAYWDAARRGMGDAAGTRALIEILLAHRTLPAAALITAMGKAVDAGILDPQVVVIEARREANGHVALVIPIGALARYDRPAPTLAAYDDLLTGSGT